jgi:radical SAM protein with 4Fe4S-binding SPASM domain
MVIPYTRLKDHNRHNLAEVIPLEKPFTLIIEPSSLCNFRCVQCYQSISDSTRFSRSRGNMSMDTFSRAIDQMRGWRGPPLKVLKLSLYGEPLLNPHFLEMLRIAKAAGIAERIETTTNASLLTAAFAAGLIDHGLDYLRVSIYSAAGDKHERVTSSRVPLAVIREHLAELRSLKAARGRRTPFVGVKMLDTYSDENQAFAELFREVADETYLDKPHGWIAHEGKDFLEGLYDQELDTARADIRRQRSPRVACTLPFFTLAVRSNGEVSPCCIDWIGGTSLGDVRDEQLEAIWHGERMFEFRRMQLEDRKRENSSCRSCEFHLSDHYTRDNVDGVPVARLRRRVAPDERR